MTPTSDRLAKWRQQYPDRLAVARQLAMRLMGVPRDAQSPITLQAVDQTVDAILCAVYGVQQDAVPVARDEPSPAKAAAIKALDLEEIKPSGRDNALPPGDR